MFFGEYEHQKDDKNRIRIPPKFKDELGKKLVFGKGLDGVINVFPEEVMEKRAEAYYSTLNEFDEEAQAAYLEYMAAMFSVGEDKQGRVALPDALVEYAGLGKDVVTVGIGDHIAIMSKEKREEQRSRRPFEASMKILSQKLKG